MISSRPVKRRRMAIPYHTIRCHTMRRNRSLRCRSRSPGCMTPSQGSRNGLLQSLSHSLRYDWSGTQPCGQIVDQNAGTGLARCRTATGKRTESTTHHGRRLGGPRALLAGWEDESARASKQPRQQPPLWRFWESQQLQHNAISRDGAATTKSSPESQW